MTGVFLGLLFGILLRLLRDDSARERDESSAVALLLVLLAMASSLGVLAGASLFWIPLVLSLGCLASSAIARRVFVPLGWVRPAYGAGRLADWLFPGDACGRGHLAGAWAHLRAGGDRELDCWLETRMAAVSPAMAAHVAAAALLAAARGDRDGARELMRSLEDFSPRATPMSVRRLACDWLVADAVSRGAWKRAVRAGRSRPRTRLARLYCGIAERLAGDPDAPGDRGLRTLWLLAPRRRATRALVERALAHASSGASAPRPAGPTRADTVEPPRDATADHATALGAHVDALRRGSGALTTGDLVAVAAAWDRVLGAPQLKVGVMQRANALGAAGADAADAALRALRHTIARDLGAIAREARLDLAAAATGSPCLDDAARLLRDQLLGEVEIAFDALAERVEDTRDQPALDEWREFLALRAVYDRAADIGGVDFRRLAFPHVHDHTCSFAVWLWNERDERLLANAMFRWLLAEAMAVGDAEAIEIQSNNASLDV